MTTPSARSVSRLTPKRAVSVFRYRCIEMLPGGFPLDAGMSRRPVGPQHIDLGRSAYMVIANALAGEVEGLD